MTQIATMSGVQARDLQLVVFDVGQERFGVDIDRVREIIPAQQVTQIPRSPSFVRGVLDLRGVVIPVLDLRERFGMPPGETDVDRRIVVVEMGGQIVGCTVDAVSEVLTLARDAVQPPPAVAATDEAAYLLGVARHGDRLVILLDLDRVLSVIERSALADLASAAADRGTA